jgi:xylulokinase
MTKLLLGIDVGTSACKVCVLDQRGRFIASTSREYRPLCPQPGWFEQNPDDWYGAARDCIQLLGENGQVDIDRIAAVATTGQMKGATFLASDGRPVRNTILWNDLRNLAEVAELRHERGPLIDRLSYNPFNNTETVAKALWLERHEPGNWKRTRTIIFPKDYLSFRLCGSLHTDLSEASAICIFNNATQSWWPAPDTAALFPYRDRLPPIVSSTEVVGRVFQKAAEETGLPAGTTVVAGGSDAIVESLAVGHFRPDQCKIRLGTAGALVALTTNLSEIAKGRYYVWSCLKPGLWMLDNNVRACAHSTAWYRDVFFAHQPNSDRAYTRIMEEAADIPIGSQGLVFHPYLQGEDSPYWNPNLRASFFGIQASHSRAHFARAVYEGTALALRDAREAFGELVESFREYLLVGGGTRNALWLQIIADVLGIEAKIPEHADAAFGAAMLAGIGIGVFRSIDDAVERSVRFKRTVSRDPQATHIYSALFERYRGMKRIFDRVYDLDAAAPYSPED